MKLRTISLALTLAFTLALVGRGLVAAAYTPSDSEGTISGIVVSPTGRVVDWAQIYARTGNQTFQAFSGFSGFYLMRVPAGTYNVSVYDFYDPQAWAPNANVTVLDGSSNTVNFYLQPQAPTTTPVPELPENITVLVTILALASTCIMVRRFKK